jgi:hypothetical protein
MSCVNTVNTLTNLLDPTSRHQDHGSHIRQCDQRDLVAGGVSWVFAAHNVVSVPWMLVRDNIHFIKGNTCSIPPFQSTNQPNMKQQAGQSGGTSDRYH